MEHNLARIHEGGTRGRHTTSERKREQAAQGREALLAAVEAYWKKHPDADLSTIAKALDSRRQDRSRRPEDEERAIQARTKRIRRAKRLWTHRGDVSLASAKLGRMKTKNSEQVLSLHAVVAGSRPCVRTRRHEGGKQIPPGLGRTPGVRS